MSIIFATSAAPALLGSRRMRLSTNPLRAIRRMPMRFPSWRPKGIAARPVIGCSTVILRPTNVVDEDRLGELGLPADGSPKSRLKAFVKGGECAHIIHAEDVAAAAIYFMDRPRSPDPRIFFVSLDHDPLNTVAGLWSLYRGAAAGKNTEDFASFPYLPMVIPYMLRRQSRVFPLAKDYVASPVSKEVVRVVQSYTDYINRTVCRGQRTGRTQ